VAFEGKSELGIEAFAVGEDGGEKIAGIVGFHPSGLPGLDGVGC